MFPKRKWWLLTVTTLGSRCPVLTPRPLSLLAALFLLLWAGLWLCCTCSLPGLLALMSPPAGPAPTATGPAHSPPCCSGPPPPGRTTVVGVGLPPRNCNIHRKYRLQVHKLVFLPLHFLSTFFYWAHRAVQQSSKIISADVGDLFFFFFFLAWYSFMAVHAQVCQLVVLAVQWRRVLWFICIHHVSNLSC